MSELLTSVDHLVHGAERARLAGEGALAVDMESAWLGVCSHGAAARRTARRARHADSRDLPAAGHPRRRIRGVAGVARTGRRRHWRSGARA